METILIYCSVVVLTDRHGKFENGFLGPALQLNLECRVVAFAKVDRAPIYADVAILDCLYPSVLLRT